MRWIRSSDAKWQIECSGSVSPVFSRLSWKFFVQLDFFSLNWIPTDATRVSVSDGVGDDECYSSTTYPSSAAASSALLWLTATICLRCFLIFCSKSECKVCVVVTVQVKPSTATNAAPVIHPASAASVTVEAPHGEGVRTRRVEYHSVSMCLWVKLWTDRAVQILKIELQPLHRIS